MPSASVIALRAPGAGAPLAGAVRAPLERSLGIDLGAVQSSEVMISAHSCALTQPAISRADRKAPA